tara:strand:- start:2461 stop:3012 length:552 start_codon:yes stop_codon:yes gene_type:complete
MNDNNILDLNNKINIINNKFYEAFLTKNWNIYEISLNILFIFLLILISILIYWDSINKKISEKSRCRKQKELYNKTKGVYSINVKTKNNENLFKIDYDINNKKEKINCSCNKGNANNTFSKIPIRILKSNENKYSEDLYCKCDKEYHYDNSNKDLVLEGEPELIRYMNNQDSDDFFQKINFNF